MERLSEMAKGQRHCGRVVVSDLWTTCPFCGDSLKKKTSPSSSTDNSRRKSSDIDFDSLSVRQLRAYLKQNGAKVSGKKADLIERLASALDSPEAGRLKYDF